MDNENSAAEVTETVEAQPQPESAPAQPVQDYEKVREERTHRAMTAINGELSRISELDPDIKSFDDILNSDIADEFTSKVKKGYTLYDAFLISSNKKIMNRIATAAHQSALNSANSKDHLRAASASTHEAAVEVPAKTYSLYKDIFPDITDEQIRAHYRRTNSTAKNK